MAFFSPGHGKIASAGVPECGLHDRALVGANVLWCDRDRVELVPVEVHTLVQQSDVVLVASNEEGCDDVIDPNLVLQSELRSGLGKGDETSGEVSPECGPELIGSFRSLGHFLSLLGGQALGLSDEHGLELLDLLLEFA